ncbi:unnamed protein product [Linum trigynum]|uniref:Uncharacterized protein n=1 Tax=Linum trigynum TaxID=586398 RepID=A0AAV2E918_9ROSI
MEKLMDSLKLQFGIYPTAKDDLGPIERVNFTDWRREAQPDLEKKSLSYAGAVDGSLAKGKQVLREFKNDCIWRMDA